MGLNRPVLRRLFSVLVAVAFVIAAEPGSMAMPQGSHANAAQALATMPGCNHVPADKSQGKFHDSVTFCPGMLACYGLSAASVCHVVPSHVAALAPPPQLGKAMQGLSPRPENPPPIA